MGALKRQANLELIISLAPFGISRNTWRPVVSTPTCLPFLKAPHVTLRLLSTADCGSTTGLSAFRLTNQLDSPLLRLTTHTSPEPDLRNVRNRLRDLQILSAIPCLGIDFCCVVEFTCPSRSEQDEGPKRIAHLAILFVSVVVIPNDANSSDLFSRRVNLMNVYTNALGKSKLKLHTSYI